MSRFSKFRSGWTRLGALIVLMAAAATAMAQDQQASNMDLLRDKLKAKTRRATYECGRPLSLPVRPAS